MSRIVFPKQLEDLLAGSDLRAPIRRYADRVSAILAHNKTPFFPDYTDHGVAHAQRVLETAVELVPASVWQQSTGKARPRILGPEDAVVLIGTILLHDLAMHIASAREDL